MSNLEPQYPTTHHPSSFLTYQYVYPVISRRSHGLSIGINLSPGGHCSFSCIYCQTNRKDNKNLSKQIDRSKLWNLESESDSSLPENSSRIDISLLEKELREILAFIEDGSIFQQDNFARTSSEQRRLNDFAFSGDGEPTLSPQFGEALECVIRVKNEFRLDSVKIVLITNATVLNQNRIQTLLPVLLKNNGEIWAKLDAGTEQKYQQMSRSTVPFSKILDNIYQTALSFPIIIQTMLLSENGIEPSLEEMSSYTQQLNDFLKKGCQLKKIQLYTVARPPLESSVSALSDEKMNRWKYFVEQETQIPVEVFYSK